MARTVTATCLGALALTACSPQYDWREVRGTGEPYVVLLPGKPSSFSRPINLDGNQVTMLMTATEVNGVTFAVGSATMPDALKAQAALAAMKSALVSNINGTIKRESATPAAPVTSIEIEASGNRKGEAQPLLLIGRFVARQQRIYQVLVVGKEKSVSREAVDTFLTSFKPG